jgi:hypothetical protein
MKCTNRAPPPSPHTAILVVHQIEIKREKLPPPNRQTETDRQKLSTYGRKVRKHENAGI